MKTTKLKTCEVKYKESGAIGIINERDFDHELHKRVTSRPKKKDEDADKEETQDETLVFGTEPRQDLALMTADALRGLPEWKVATDEQRAGSNRKADIIDVILAVRG